MKEIVYRRLNKDEIKLMVDYRIIFLRELQGEQTPETEEKLRQELTAYFEKALADGSFIGRVAEIDSKLIGIGGMVLLQVPGNFHLPNGRWGYILSVYTIPEYRKRGIGSEIINQFIEEGKNLGLSKVYLHASNDGIELYRKKGFVDPDLPELELKY